MNAKILYMADGFNKKSEVFLEIAKDSVNNCKILFNRKDKSLKLLSNNEEFKKATFKKIKKELEDKNYTNDSILKTHRAIRNIVGNPEAGTGIYPKKLSNNKGYIPKVDRNCYFDSFKWLTQFDKTQDNLKNKNSQAANIIVKITKAGICQSDRRVMLGTKTSSFDKEKIVLGHEGGGYIIDPGLYSELFHVGQKIVLLPHLTCWNSSCKYCNSYKQNLCINMKHIGFHIQGNMTSLMAYPEQCIMSVPEELDDKLLPLIEPLACVSRGIFFLKNYLNKLNFSNRFNKRQGRFTIYGGGSIGCLAAICCKIFYKNILVEIVDVNKERLSVIKQLNIADEYSLEPKNIHHISFIANSFFNSVKDAFRYSHNGSPILLFSGINTNEFSNKAGEFNDLANCCEQIHRQELDKTLLLHNGKNLRLLGSSGYNYADIRRSISFLLNYQCNFQVIQNAVIDGFNANYIKFLYPINKRMRLKKALISLLSPKGILDDKFGTYIAKTIKPLINI